jgi:hypothetical protein
VTPTTPREIALRSDAGRASSTFASSPSPTASADHLAGAALNVVLTAQGRGRFDVSLNDSPIVKASTQPICEAARVLNRNGYPDDCRLIARHEGAAISGELGFWRKQRIREDRGLRYVAWEPRPRRVDVKKGGSKLKAAEHRAEKKNAFATTSGAAYRPSAAIRSPKPGGTRRKPLSRVIGANNACSARRHVSCPTSRLRRPGGR